MGKVIYSGTKSSPRSSPDVDAVAESYITHDPPRMLMQWRKFHHTQSSPDVDTVGKDKQLSLDVDAQGLSVEKDLLSKNLAAATSYSLTLTWGQYLSLRKRFESIHLFHHCHIVPIRAHCKISLLRRTDKQKDHTKSVTKTKEAC